MVAKHKHAGIVCRSGLSKPECDALWRSYQHFHTGEPCVIRDEPAKKGRSKRVCVLEAAGKAAELQRLHALVTRGVVYDDRPSFESSIIVPEG
jgi:hypothetical protein